MCLKLHIQGVLGATKDHAKPELSVVFAFSGFSGRIFLQKGRKCLRETLGQRKFWSLIVNLQKALWVTKKLPYSKESCVQRHLINASVIDRTLVEYWLD